MVRQMCVTILFVVILSASAARAERPPQDKSTATDVVVGQVQKVSTKESPFGNDGVKTTYTAEIKVREVEKGNSKIGDSVTFTWFHVTKKPSGLIVGAFGHAYQCTPGDVSRVYLIKRKDLYEVIYNRSGLELLPPK